VEVDAPAEPAALREVVFELAARLPRADAIGITAARFQIEPEQVVGSLFADRPSRRVLRAPRSGIAPADLVARYNLALAQTLLSRAMEVEATVAGPAEPIAIAAKRAGLLTRFEAAGEGRTRLVVAGPLALFHDTTKYGRSIGRLVPSLVAAPSWSLRARVVVAGAGSDLVLDDGGAIAFATTLPAEPDGHLARKLARALRAAGHRVDLSPPLVPCGPTLVVPDLSLRCQGRDVLVDIVPYATGPYLDAKLATVDAIASPMVLCVDARVLAANGRGPDPRIVPFVQHVDPVALLVAAEACARRS
jgi:predicted nuclease of restriction endonuclease-like RecB superfamily